MKLDGKVALITGGNSGRGRATAALFAKEGAAVVITGRNQERGETAEEIARAVLFLACDDSFWVAGAALVVDGGGIAG